MKHKMRNPSKITSLRGVTNRASGITLSRSTLNASRMAPGLAMCASEEADDWPEWGGQPMRNMHSLAKNLPSSIGKIEFKPGTEEIQTKGVKSLKFALKLGSQS